MGSGSFYATTNDIKLSFIFLLVLFFGFLGFFKIKDYTVDAIPKSCRGWTILENVSEMRFASTALNFGACHPMCIIGQIKNGGFADGGIETRPSAAAFKFSIALKKCIAASSTIIGAFVCMFFPDTGIRPFCTFFTGYIVKFRRENFFPFSGRKRNFTGIGSRVCWMVVFGIIHRWCCLSGLCWTGIQNKQKGK